MGSTHRSDRSEQAAKLRGNLLLGASLTAWSGTMWLVWQVGGMPSQPFVPLAAVGGAVGGALGALRALPDRLPRDDGWILFRLVSSIATAGAWGFVIHELWRNDEIDEQVLNFLLGFVIYGIARDLLQTVMLAGWGRLEARRLEQAREEQRRRVFALTEQRAARPYCHEPVRRS